MNKVEIKKVLETRALPPLVEEMNNHIAAMEALVNGAKAETRALKAEEVEQYNELKDKVAAIQTTLKIEEESRAYVMTPDKAATQEEKRSADETNFLKFVRGEQRALTVGENGAIIPKTIANKIIDKVKELSPIYRLSTIYNVGGDLVFPVYDESENKVSAAYVEDMAELTEKTGKFKTVTLTNYIVGCLSKLSKSLINRQDFDLLSFIVDKVGQAISEFIENELLNGTTKANGLAKIEGGISTTSLKADDLIDVQMSIVEQFQGNSCWIMHKDNLKAIRKFKTSDGEYLLNKDMTKGFGWMLLGKPVYISENCPKNTIFYGDMSGLYVKLTKSVELQLLHEKYATQYAVGVCGYVEFDSKIVEPQKLTKLTVAPGK